MHLFRSPRPLGVVLALAFLSCNPGDGIAPRAARTPVPQADAVATAGLPAVRVSELHYDNTGTDAGEAIEVSGPAGTDLTGWQLVLYNGSGGAPYTTTTLSGSIPATCDPRGVVVITYAVNGIQNGSPDGVALVSPGSGVVEFLSYEGTFAAVGGPANGTTSKDIGAAEAGTEPVGQSLKRSGSDVWSGPSANSFGACNDNDEPPPPPPPPPPPGLPDTRFSEIHYDNTGTDAGEAIEIEGQAATDVTGWSVVLYNGDPASRAPYDTQALSGTIPALCDGRGVLVLNYATNGIQNGSPDGLALVDAGGRVVEFLSYEGAFIALGGPADGLTSTDIGVLESSSPFGQSLQREAAGAWSGPKANTFGFCNSAPPPPPASTITFTGRLASDPALPVGFQDQIFATLLDGGGNAVATTFTWSSETPSVASIDQSGVMTALDAGTAIVRATAAEGTTATFSLPMRVAIASTSASYQGNAEFGEPADGDASDDFVVRRPQYTASYNHTRGTPNWVSYDLEATHFGAEDRCDCFTFDPELPAAFSHYTTADYTGAGAFHGYGIDRGHLARSFDRTSASLDNATTFYFTNIVPQAADLNQGPWAVLENTLGDLARFQNNEVYVIAGPAGSKGTVKNEGKITIPASTWKVALILPRDHGLADVHSSQDVEVIAVIMPNDPGVRNVDWQSYRTTVDAVEASSGYDLLARLPDPIEIAVESNTKPPNAAVDGPYTSLPNNAVPMSAAGSGDPDGDALTYAWTFGDGAGAAGAVVAHTYADAGAYAVQVIVTDIRGLADTVATTARVLTPVQGLQNALALVGVLAGNGTLDGRDARWLTLKLSLAVEHLQRGHPAPAVEQLEAILERLRGAAGVETLRAAVSRLVQAVRL